VEAHLRFKYDDKRTAEAVAKAVTPDNLMTPHDIAITTMQVESEVTIWITCKKGLETLLATLDDLLGCVSAVEQSLNVVQEIERRQTL